MSVELLYREAPPDTGFGFDPDAPAVGTLLSGRLPDSTDGLPWVTKLVLGGFEPSRCHGLVKVRVEAHVGLIVKDGVRWELRWFAAVGKDSAARDKPMRRESFEEVTYDVDVRMFGSVDDKSHKGQVVFGTYMSHRWRHVFDHSVPQWRYHGLAVSQQSHAPLSPRGNVFSLADNKFNGFQQISREAEVCVLNGVRETLGRLEEGKLITAVPSQRETRGLVTDSLVNRLYRRPRRRLVHR